MERLSWQTTSVLRHRALCAGARSEYNAMYMLGGLVMPNGSPLLNASEAYLLCRDLNERR